MKSQLALALSVLITTSVFAQTDSQTSKPKTSHRSSSAPVSKQLEDMKDAISAQQQQIQQLQQQISTRDQAIQQLQTQVTAAQSAAQQAQDAANAAVPKAEELDKQYFDPLQHDVADLKTVSGNTVNELQETQKRVAGLESPLAIHYKGITITPGGFLAAETVWRQHAEGADINTGFNQIPFSGASGAHMSEFYGSARQSRISMLAQGKTDETNFTGYVESDFLGVGTASNNNQSNSYVLRMRQAWGQAALNSGWSFTGGQMWSLVTETKQGVDNRTEALPMTIDPQYTVGFSWARQYAFRVSKNINNKIWVAGSVEDSQETVTTHGNTSNYLFGSQGLPQGLYNSSISGCSTALVSGSPVTTCTNNANYSWNPSPDFIGKIVFQPGWGHYEVFGIASQFRDRVFPDAGLTVPTAAGAYNYSTWTGGYGANARWSFWQKRIDFGLHYLGGRGMGRYGTAGLADATVSPAGTVVPIRSNQGLITLEYHSQKWDWYSNVGEEADSRTAFLNSKGKPVGYGSVLFSNAGCGVETLPGSGSGILSAGFSPGGLANCNGDARNIIEGTLGFWYKPYNGPKGRLQFGAQYSYVDKNTWNGIGGPYSGPSPNAIDNMFFTSFRYYLP
jgi:TolA-binding protein